MAERPKPRCWGSVSGMPSEMTARSDGGRWWGSLYKAMVVVGWCVCKLRDRGGVGPKTRNRGFVTWFRGRHVKQRCGMMLGGGGCGSMTWRWWGGAVCAPTRGQGARFRPKTRNRAFVAQFRVRRVKRQCGGDAGRWWVRVNDIEAVGGLRVRQREARRRGLGQKPETERSSLGFGCAV